MKYQRKKWTIIFFRNKNDHPLRLPKAFDSLDRKILLNKLEYYGFRNFSLKWLESYLSQRKQCVSFGSAESPLLPVNFEVPQDGIVAPIIFILCINDII